MSPPSFRALRAFDDLFPGLTGPLRYSIGETTCHTFLCHSSAGFPLVSVIDTISGNTYWLVVRCPSRPWGLFCGGDWNRTCDRHSEASSPGLIATSSARARLGLPAGICHRGFFADRRVGALRGNLILLRGSWPRETQRPGHRALQSLWLGRYLFIPAMAILGGLFSMCACSHGTRRLRTIFFFASSPPNFCQAPSPEISLRPQRCLPSCRTVDSQLLVAGGSDQPTIFGLGKGVSAGRDVSSHAASVVLSGGLS